METALQTLDQKISFIETGKNEDILMFLSEFKNTIEGLENEYSREEIVRHIPAIRKAASHSPFVNRAQIWPKGYQGDFETIEQIIYQKNKAVPNTFGFIIEDFLLNSDVCKQHINKVKRQSELILKTVQQNPNAKILSIGCGTSEDIKLNIEAIKKTNAAITLLDADTDALKYSSMALQEIKDQVKTVHGNIYKLIRTITEQYDLVIIGGVFDYLTDKVIIKILSSLKNNLNQGALIYFTNIKKNNPYRVYMEYFSDWMLIERSEEDINMLLKESTWSKSNTNIQTDATGLTYLVELNYC